MITYTFTCPLEKCGQIMTNHEVNSDKAVKDLVMQAKAHLQVVHPDIHKTDEEIDADIRAHMVVVES